MLRVHVLGDLELERDGEALEPPQRGPARSLLGWLALHPGVHSRAAVAAALWPRVLDTSARASLRTALSALRAAVGPDAVVAGRTSVGLARAPHVWIDVDEFEGLRAAGRAQEALALCRGELLAGIEEDWALAARDAHRDAQGGLPAPRARHAARAGDVASAITLARRRAALDPFDERAHRELLALMRDADDTAGALVAHERFAERLRRQL